MSLALAAMRALMESKGFTAEELAWEGKKRYLIRRQGELFADVILYADEVGMEGVGDIFGTPSQTK